MNDTLPPAAWLWDDARDRALAVDQVRDGANGQIVLRITRKLPNHPAFDPVEDAAHERVLRAFTAWLERPDGSRTQVVRLTEPRGAELRDVGKWALEYALVGEISASRDG